MEPGKIKNVTSQVAVIQPMFETGLTAYTEGVNEPGIIKLEHSLLELAGCPDLLNGLFYMLPLYTNGHLYIRYIYINLLNK